MIFVLKKASMKKKTSLSKSNIFYFATKELSQDAFLSWLLCGYNSKEEDVKFFSRLLINEIFNNQFSDSDFDNISRFAVDTQFHSIDIATKFTINDKTYAFLIEDKVGSKIHNKSGKKISQLEEYKKILEEEYAKDANVYKCVLYTVLDLSEFDKVSCDKQGYKIISLSDIYKIFNSEKNVIVNRYLKDYSEYVSTIFDNHISKH